MAGFLRRHRQVAPFLLLGPGLLWLVAFYVYPGFQMFLTSFWTGSLERGFDFSLDNWQTYPTAISRYSEQFVRSIGYSAAATILTFLIAYPLAYTIAFRAGRYKNLLLFLVIAPFFTSYLLRTISWKIILADSGLFFGPLKDLGVLPEEFRVLSTAVAVVSGITYNFLPFMVLPLYVSLEKIDDRLVEAAKDLYAGPWRRDGAIVGGIAGAILGVLLAITFGLPPVVAGGAFIVAGAIVGSVFISESFVRVTFPLSLPGVFAATLLTFIPALGDYINAELLGSPGTRMIGNVIQNRFLTLNDYPTAAALSFTLMAAILVAIAIYTRVLGTEALESVTVPR